jgi:hypothetical protein
MKSTKLTTEVEIMKIKNGVATVIRVDGHQYALQHPNQMKR